MQEKNRHLQITRIVEWKSIQNEAYFCKKKQMQKL